MKTCAAGSWNDGIGIAVKPLLLAKVRSGRVYPDKRVLVVGYALELIGLQSFVALNDGLAVYSSRYDSAVSTRLLTALGQVSLLRTRSIHD